MGTLLGAAYSLFAILLFLGCLGIHQVVFVGVLVRALIGKPRPPVWFWPIEVAYGLINPVVYLVVFQPALVRGGEWPALTATGWFLLCAVWLLRFGGNSHGRLARSCRLPLQLLLASVIACIGVFFIRDIAGSTYELVDHLNAPFSWLYASGQLAL